MPYRWRLLPIQALVDITGPLNVLGVTVLLPFVQSEFAVARTTVVWLIVGYSLGTASFILPAAYLGNNLGRRRLVVLGALMGMVSQIGVFLTPGLGLLVLVRVVSGIANAFMMANLPALVVGAFPSERRGRALGLIAIGLGSGVLSAPVVAGVFADTVGWRYIFLLIASLYVLVLMGALFVVREAPVASPGPVSLRRFDYPGVALVVAVLTSLTFSMQRFGASADPVLGAALLGLAVAFGVMFVLAEQRSPYPLIDPRLFRVRAFGLSVARNVCVLAMWSSNSFLLPFYMIQGLGWSGSFAGVVLLAHYSGRLFVSPLSGYLVDRVGPGRPILVAFGLVVAGTILLISLGSDPPLYHVLAGLLVVGAGFGIFAPPIQAVIYASVPPEKLSLAPGTYSLTAHIGINVGAPLAAAFLGVFLGESISSAFQWTLVVMLGGFVGLFGAASLLMGSRRKVGAAG